VPYTGADMITIGDENTDSSLDPRQATLYSWWFNHRESFKALSDQIEKTLNEYDKGSIDSQSHEMEASRKTDAEIARLEDVLRQLSSALSTMTRFTPRLSESLRRFDDWVGLSLRVQSRRWIVLDLMFPISVGCAALGLLTWRTFFAS